MNSAGTFNAYDALGGWFVTNSSFFTNAYIKNGSYKFIGVACTCDYLSEVVCGFMLTDCVHGKDVSDSLPKFIDYTASGSCAAVPLSSLF